MCVLDTPRGVGLAARLAVPAAALEPGAPTTTGQVRAEIAQAMDAIAAYSEQERDQALAAAGETLTRLDAEIDRREKAPREGCSEMSQATRDTAAARLRDPRQARNRPGERYGAPESGAGRAREDLKTGVLDARGAVSEAWSAADKDASTN